MNQKENLELKSMDEFLPILAIETSSRICSVSLYISDNLYSEFSVNQKNIHSEKLFELINQTLESLEYSFDQIKAIAVSIGPGSFTGLRIGVSAAKGLAFGRKIPIIPVPTFEALALQISNYLSKSTEFTICNSVNRDELYKSDFISDGENNYKIKNDLELISREDFIIEDNSKLVFGDYKNKSSLVSIPSSMFIAKWAYLFGKDLLTFDYDYLEPNYIKKFVARIKQ